jgi:hypothetical protein
MRSLGSKHREEQPTKLRGPASFCARAGPAWSSRRTHFSFGSYHYRFSGGPEDYQSPSARSQNKESHYRCPS